MPKVPLRLAATRREDQVEYDMPTASDMKHLCDVVAPTGQQEWSKPDPAHTFRGRLDGSRAVANEVVYEDDDVFAFRHRVDPSAEEWWEMHVVIIPKKWIPTILDIGIGDLHVWNALIGGIQKVAISLGMYETGFMIRMGVLPPYQHTEHVHIHILAGKHTLPNSANLITSVS